jgi:hypothetical protein
VLFPQCLPAPWAVSKVRAHPRQTNRLQASSNGRTSRPSFLRGLGRAPAPAPLRGRLAARGIRAYRAAQHVKLG